MTDAFDPEKDARNLADRGLSLAFGLDVIAGRIVELEDRRFDYGERRIICFGTVGGRLYVCVYTVRETGPRIISVRKANERERARYERST